MAPTIAHVPAGHDYVRHLLPLPGEEDGTRHLPDPPPATDGPTRPGQWWPAAWLEPGFVAEHEERLGARADLVHLHFGFEGRTPDQLRAWLRALEAAGLPLVLTVHDLRNPHLLDGRAHDEALDVLVPAAAAVLTLTQGAAHEIRQRWGREALVVPHPHIVPLELLPAEAPSGAGPGDRTAGPLVGVHLKSLRASTDPRLVELLAQACADVPGARLRVDLHEEVTDPAHPRHDAALLARLGELRAAGSLDLRVHGPLDDAAFRAYLSGLDLAVLPYRFGTHSGWLEACHDLGTPVLAPGDTGHWGEQQRVLAFPSLHEGTSAQVAATHAALVHGIEQVASGVAADSGATRAERAAQRRRVARAHAQVYARVLRRQGEQEAPGGHGRGPGAPGAGGAAAAIVDETGDAALGTGTGL